MNSPAYDEGYEAYIAGASILENPYIQLDVEPDLKDYYDWFTGWMNAQEQFNRD